MKIRIGMLYMVGKPSLEAGNVIEVTSKSHGNYTYRTVEVTGIKPMEAECRFEAGSPFARSLMPYKCEEKIVIWRHKNRTVATHYLNGTEINRGIAKCDPEDAFDFAFGAKLALERLLDCMDSAPETAFDWDKFISGDVWVQTNSSNTDAFLQACEEHHLTNRAGDRPTKLNVFRDFNNASEIEKALYGIFGLIPRENIWFATRDGKLRWGNKKPTGEIFEWGQAE